MGAVPDPGSISETPLSKALSERYLAYALSTIVSRSLPDVRDGLKPVHRRLLYAMRQLKLDPDSGFKKCARVVGDVIGKYHPHGDQSVYDALVRLAQDFAVRYPLVDGQGNFGNIDGDNAAAMRYTESRLTAAAWALMDGLDQDAVDFRETYDGEESEPVVMPAAIPNLLANGASGIAVGMATNIPPHNIAEICDALLHLIKFPEARTATLVDKLQGPDFPTGGVIAENRDTIVEAYHTGRGSVRIRAKWDVEKLSHGQYQVVITEIPYQVQKAKLIERIAELMTARKLPLLADIRDESTELVRVVLEPKNRSVDPEMLMEQLFKQTDLESRFGLNMNVLDADGTPKVMGLASVLQAFLNHRHQVLIRRSNHRLDKILTRLEVLDGYIIAFLNLDEVIRIIREEDEPKAVMMETFKLTDAQVDAILNMRLRSLRKLEEMELRAEHTALSDEQAGLEALLKDEKRQWTVIGDQIKETRKAFGPDTDLGRRRTDFTDAPSAVVVPIEAFVEKEPITIVLSEKGWVRAMKGHQDSFKDLKFKEGDRFADAIQAFTTDKVLFFGSDGRFYTVAADKLPGGRGYGEPVRLLFDLPNDAVIQTMTVFKGGRKFLVASDVGRGFVVAEDTLVAQTKNGKQILNLGAGEEARVCQEVTGDSVAVVGRNRKLLVFPLEDLPEMTRGRGVILQRYKDGGLADAKTFSMADGLSWALGDRTRTETNLTAWVGKRGQAGRLPPQGFPKNNKFS